MQPRRSGRSAWQVIAAAALGLWALASGSPRAAADPLRGATTALARFLGPDAAPLASYRALRRLTASTRGGRMDATVIAWTELDPTRGFVYQVISSNGSPLIQNRVLIPVLDAETQAVASGEGAHAAITPENYRFDPSGDSYDGLLRVGMAPTREGPMLLEGAIFLRAQDGDLVRLEGRLVKRPSFWTRRVDIVRRYRRIAGVRVPIEMESIAQVLIVGPSTFTMTWDYESVNGVSVGTPGAQAVATSGK